jgi:DNA polymerase-3 subunit gamma/tau
MQTASIPPITPAREVKIKSSPRTPQLTSLLKGGGKSDESASSNSEVVANEPYTEEQLREVWSAFAEQRRKFQAEYQLLTQPFKVENHLITVQLLSPLHETMLNNLRSDLTSFLRERLRNNSIQVTGELIAEEDKKLIYTNREKFEFLAEKNPMLKELKDRLGLDTDF